MKRTKKILAIMLTLVIGLMSFVGCGDKKESENATWKDDLANSGKVVIGYTVNAPMGIEEDDGTVSGFDIELARAIFKDTGVEIEPKLIKWSSKEMELNAKTIDLVWNGLTVDPDREKNMQLSENYLINEQAVVVKKANAQNFTSVNSLEGKKVAVESESAGMSALDQINKGTKVELDSQIMALTEVKAGKSDVAIIDATMAGYLLKEDTSFADLQIVDIKYEFTKEYYAVAAKKGNTKLIDFINEGLKKTQENGKYDELLAKYGLDSRKCIIK